MITFILLLEGEVHEIPGRVAHYNAGKSGRLVDTFCAEDGFFPSVCSGAQHTVLLWIAQPSETEIKGVRDLMLSLLLEVTLGFAHG